MDMEKSLLVKFVAMMDVLIKLRKEEEYAGATVNVKFVVMMNVPT